jgi:hypothetical protein
MQTLRILLICCCPSGGCIFDFFWPASQADIRLQVQSAKLLTTKAKSRIQVHIYRYIYMYISRNSLDRRRFLRSIASLAASEQHRERLLELCDEDGALEDYTKGGRATVGGVFTDFDSVRPGLSQLISIMPRLRPRPYSSMPQIPGEMPDSGLLPRCFYI